MITDLSRKNLDTKVFREVLMEAAMPEIEKIAEKVEEDIKNVSMDAIDCFYGDYPPEVYERIYSMGSENKGPNSYLFRSHKESINDTKKMGVSIIFEYSPQYMTGEHKSGITHDFIFDQAFLEGYHGGYNGQLLIGPGGPVKRSTPPWEIIKGYIENTY